ncbi:MAG: glycosyltransferase family 2 protein [Paracoccaceae bacterium]
MDTLSPDTPKTGFGVIIVLHRSGDVIDACLSSLISQGSAIARIVLVDNGCPDGSADIAIRTAQRHGVRVSTATPHGVPDLHQTGITIIRSRENLGFAGGVNLGMSLLMPDPAVAFFWILNPDCTVPAGMANRLLEDAHAKAPEGFALMGMRILYQNAPRAIQSDGGRWCRWTGRCRSLNQGARPEGTALPDPDCLDFISGASMVATRRFVDQAGPMPEDYFLYYEEVDWAARRGRLPLAWSARTHVAHHGGTAIGSGAIDRAPSPLSLYFNTRNRLRFVQRHRWPALPVAYAFGIAKVIQSLLRRQYPQAVAAFRGLHGLQPSHAVAIRIAEQDHERAFGHPPTPTSLTAPQQEPA